MNGPPWVVLAGLPQEVGAEIVQRLRPNVRGISWLPLGEGMNYTAFYAKGLYDRMCAGFRRTEGNDREELLRGVRLVVVYLPRGDGSHAPLLEQFRVEALVMALREDAVGGLSWATARERRGIVNRVVREVNRTVRDAETLLGEIVDEIGTRSTRTCLLLPPRNFGRASMRVFEFVERAGLRRMTRQQFRTGLDRVANSIDSTRENRRRHFIGRGGLVFRTGPKHGLAPVWGDAEHEPSCVVRGRLRCGASFNPRFHYDCSDAKKRVVLANCHDQSEKLSVSATDYVNIAPNDNVRGG